MAPIGLAETNILAGLANRRAFLEAAESTLERWSRTKSPLTWMKIDAGHFKMVKSTYQHHAGHAVLRYLAERYLQRPHAR